MIADAAVHALGARQRLRAPRPPPAAGARSRARSGPQRQPAPRRRLLRRAGQHGGRRPDRRARRRARRRSRLRIRPDIDPAPTEVRPCLTSSTASCPRSSRRSPRTATTSTPTRSRAIVDRLIAGGVGGLVPGGSTGEFTTLTHAERRRLVEVTIEAAAGRVPVVAGTGALSTRRDGRAERPRRAQRRRRGDDRAAVLRRARAGASCSPTTGAVADADLDPDHVLQPPERDGRDARRRAVTRAAARRGRHLRSRTPAATRSPRPS